jgi:hypothetical protein
LRDSESVPSKPTRRCPNATMAGPRGVSGADVDDKTYSCAKISSGVSVTSILGVGALSPMTTGGTAAGGTPKSIRVVESRVRVSRNACPRFTWVVASDPLWILVTFTQPVVIPLPLSNQRRPSWYVSAPTHAGIVGRCGRQSRDRAPRSPSAPGANTAAAT